MRVGVNPVPRGLLVSLVLYFAVQPASGPSVWAFLDGTPILSIATRHQLTAARIRLSVSPISCDGAQNIMVGHF